jgi:hypothetical protein
VPSINDVMVLGVEGGQWFCNDSVTRVKVVKNMVTSFMNDHFRVVVRAIIDWKFLADQIIKVDHNTKRR